ncbi:flagellar export protein FliJ [Spongisporangium articulatum]|uniref:Flagellar FliJ protein n=1 Tax=Spongisporangium articulatum TaxID=3362603 RepID=A0ABW8AJQ4_9ACTN
MSATFRLGTLERLREDRVDEAAKALATAAAAVEEAVGRRDLLAAQLQRSSGPAVGQRYANAHDLVTGALFRERLRDMVRAAAGEIARLEEAREAARTDWLEARAQLRAVQMLHDRHRATVAKERIRKEQIELDEFALRNRELVGPGGDDR